MMRARIAVLWGSFVVALTCFVLASVPIGFVPLSPVMLVEWERNDVAAADNLTALLKASTDSGNFVVPLKEGNAKLGQFGPILTAESVHIADLLTKPHSAEETKVLEDKKGIVEGTNEGVSIVIADDTALIAAIGAIKFEALYNELIRFRNNLWARLHPKRKPMDEITIQPQVVKDPGKPPDSPTATGVLDLVEQNVDLFVDLLDPLSAKQKAVAETYKTTLSDLANSLAVHLAALKAEKIKLEKMFPPPGDQTPVDPDLVMKLSLVASLIPSIDNEVIRAGDAEAARKADAFFNGTMIDSVQSDIQKFQADAEMLKKMKK